MNHPQPSISVQFGREWRIRRAPIYRYLPKQFVDNFFSTGTLRISSFSQFASHIDEQRLDLEEGQGMILNRNTQGDGQTVFARLEQGKNAYVLCGSMTQSHELAQSFKTDSGFKINDSIAFCEALSRYIPGFVGGMEGPCSYVQDRMVVRDIGPVDLDSVRTGPGIDDFDHEKMAKKLFEIAGDDFFFLKHSRFSPQSEYRFLWLTPNQVTGTVDIVCPEARQFCTRFEDLWAERGGAA
jgi:hypothetical protein